MAVAQIIAYSRISVDSFTMKHAPGLKRAWPISRPHYNMDLSIALIIQSQKNTDNLATNRGIDLGNKTSG